MRHFVIVGVLVLVLATALYFGLNALHLMPVEASAQAIPIDWLWNWQVIAMSFLFALIIVPMVYSLIVFRRKKGDVTDAEHIEGNTTLEIAWTIIPLFVVVTFAYMGAYSLGETRRVDPQAMIINVTASQWTWSFEYPEYGIVTKELYLPVNQQVLLKMQSRDVIHSFWVPEFRVKQDVVPGRITEYRITPIREGSYMVRCAEICGTSHSYMEKPVVVVSKDDFGTWVTQQQAVAAAAQTPESRGQNLAQTYCFSCHSATSTPVNGVNAPVWFGLFGSKVELEDGTTVTADEAYLTESIQNPAAKIVKGYQPIMPNFGLTDQQISDIVAYIKTLK